MTATRDQNQADWTARSTYWVKTAPESVSKTDDLNQLLIAMAGIGPGSRVLDIACGAGDPAISIALAVGAEGSVTALDASADMLEGARKRAEKLNLANMAFENARMESLPFEDDVFDAVTCRFGLMSAEDPVLALSEARRVLKPGGKAAYLTHGARDKNTLFSVLWPAVNGFLGDEDANDRSARRFKFSQKGSLVAVFEASGFSHIEEREVSRPDIRPREGRFWQTMLLRAFGTRIEGLDEARMEALHACIAEAFAPYLKGDHYELVSTDMAACGVA